MNDPDLPALGSSISRIVQLSSSDDESIRQLAFFVLSDISLTQKILRLSNSVACKSASSDDKAITSITKAIFLLGFNSVKACALTMMLVDGMSGKHAEYVRTELTHALAASVVSRELIKTSHFGDSEEIVVVALFKNLGRLLLAAYDHGVYREMMDLIQQGTHTSGQAYVQVLGFNLDTFTETVLEEWNIPISIIQALKNRYMGVLNVPRHKQEWMQQAAEFSEKITPLILGNADLGDSELKDALLKRFGKALNLDKAKLNQLITDTAEETRVLLMSANLIVVDNNQKISSDMAHTEFNISIEEDLLSELILADEEIDGIPITQRYPSGKPYNASILLLSGVQDAIEVMSSGDYKLDGLIALVLETYFRSLGFRFITLCLRDTTINQYVARNSLGEHSLEYQKAFSFPAILSIDLFHLAMEKNVDLLISDALKPNIRKLIPQWHKDLLPDARSFIVLPLVINKSPIGFFYADRQLDAPEGVTSEETRLIKTLKGQVLTALNSK